MDIKNIAEILLVRKYGFLGAAAIAVSGKIGSGIQKAQAEKIKREKASEKARIEMNARAAKVAKAERIRKAQEQAFENQV